MWLSRFGASFEVWNSSVEKVMKGPISGLSIANKTKLGITEAHNRGV